MDRGETNRHFIDFSVVLLVGMLCILFTAGAHACYSGGNGSAENPYLISKQWDLLHLGNPVNAAHWSKHFRMTCDIDMTGVAGFKPVGLRDMPFTGIFDGGGFVIRNLVVDLPKDWVGVFGVVTNGTIRNLGLEGGAFTGLSVGALICMATDSTITSCYSTADVTGTNSGGLLGTLYNCTVLDCYSTGAVTGKSRAGGLVGLVNDNLTGVISRCYATGNVTSAFYTGGLIGLNAFNSVGSVRPAVFDCYATGAITGVTYVGGLIGYNGRGCSVSDCHATGAVCGTEPVGGLCGFNSEAEFMRCYATGEVTGQTNVGGLVGLNVNRGIVDTCFSTGNVRGEQATGGLVGEDAGAWIWRSYSIGNVSGVNYTGGLVGNYGSGELSYSIVYCYSMGRVTGTTFTGGLIGKSDLQGSGLVNFWDTETSGQNTSEGGTGKTTLEMQTETTFTEAGWDFGGVWAMLPGGSYPYLIDNPQYSVPASSYSGGDGSAEAPYLISTPQDLLDLSASSHNRHWNKYFLMTCDIDMAGVKGFRPIGTSSRRFSGVFDGGGFAIMNLVIDLPEESNVGLFGVVTSGTIRNLGQEGGAISGKSVGALASLCRSSKVTSCYSTVAVAGITCGGLIGEANDLTMSDCYSTGTVTASIIAGGLVGDVARTQTGTISRCYATGDVTGAEYAGGLIGRNGFNMVQSKYPGVIACYAMGTVTGGSHVGGLIGDNYHSYAIDCHAAGAVSGTNRVGGLSGFNDFGRFERCYATGEVTGQTNVGGLVGMNYTGASVYKCYSDGTVTGEQATGGLVGQNSGGSILQSYSTSRVQGSDSTGGLVGWYSTRYHTDTKIEATYSAGLVTGTTSTGGLIGKIDVLPSLVLASFWDTETSGQETSAAGIGKTTVEMQTQTTFTEAGWNFITIWTMQPGGSYPYLINNPQDMLVPNVVGMAQSAAEETLYDTGLTVGAITEEFSHTVPVGHISNQNPVADTNVVTEEATVDLVISKGPESVSVPSVVGMVQSAALAAITETTLSLGTVTEAYSETVPAGQVISQDPAASASVASDTAVNLVVSKGAEGVMVPDVVGMTQTDAETAIIGAELTVGTVTEQFSDTVAAGNVMSQTPGAGSMASPGTAVNLVVSKGKNNIAVSISCNGATTTTPTKAGGDMMLLSIVALIFVGASKMGRRL